MTFRSIEIERFCGLVWLVVKVDELMRPPKGRAADGSTALNTFPTVAVRAIEEGVRRWRMFMIERGVWPVCLCESVVARCEAQAGCRDLKNWHHEFG